MLSALHTTSYATSGLPHPPDQGGDPPILTAATQVQAVHIHILPQERMQGEGRRGVALILTGIPVHILTV